MIIDRAGNILAGFWATDGVIVHDYDNKYNMHFAICLRYEGEENLKIAAKMQECKAQLDATDYQAIKFSDGAITEEEYAPIRIQRQAWREKYRALAKQIDTPTITRKEMDIAEDLAMGLVYDNEEQEEDDDTADQA